MQQLFWRVLQLGVATAVLFSNIHYQWTPNGYVASIVAVFAALLVSAIPIMVADVARLGRRFSEWVRGSTGAQAEPPSLHQPSRSPQLQRFSGDFQ